MGDIVPPTGAGPAKHEVIKYKGKSLKVTTYETVSAYTIFIGGYHKFCIDCMIEKRGNIAYLSDEERCSSSQKQGLCAYLSYIYANVQCSLEKNFRGGHDTKSIMNLLMSYIKRNYPQVKEIQLTDVSSKKCNNGATVQLYEMSYISTGKSWYEKNFGAKLRPDSAAAFAKEDAKFQEKKPIIGWEGIKMFMRGELPLPEEQMKELFNSTRTWQEFFGGILEKIGIADFCEFVAPWLQGFISRNMKFSFPFVTYYIPLDTYTPNSYNIEPFRGGKRRLYTAKRLKH